MLAYTFHRLFSLLLEFACTAWLSIKVKLQLYSSACPCEHFEWQAHLKHPALSWLLALLSCELSRGSVSALSKE